MQSISQHITTETIHIKNLLTNLMECSEIVRWNYSRIVMAGAGDYKWGELNEQGKEIQNQLLTMYKRFISLIRFLATDLSDTQQCILGLSAQKVLGIIEQSGYLVRMNKEELYSAALNAVDTQCNMISAAYKVTDNVYILLPDSTTLISQTELGKWEIEGIDKFKVALMPVVIEELDKNLKNEEIKSVVRNRLLEGFKAGVIIAGIKAKGQDRSNFTGRRKSDQVLLWLDMDNDEDRIIASYYEFVKANPQSQVVLITNNPALQKKAAFSGAAYCTAPLPKLAANPVKPQRGSARRR